MKRSLAGIFVFVVLLTSANSSVNAAPGSDSLMQTTTAGSTSSEEDKMKKLSPEERMKAAGRAITPRMAEQLKIVKTPHKRAEKPDLTGEVGVKKHACSEADIMGGIWKMIYFKETPAKQMDRYNRTLKHQYISFRQDMHYSRLFSRRSIDDYAKATRMMKPDLRPKYEQKFRMQNGNELLLFRGKNAVRRYSCNLVSETVSLYKKDDMVLRGYTKGGKTELYELYRRWQ